MKHSTNNSFVSNSFEISRMMVVSLLAICRGIGRGWPIKLQHLQYYTKYDSTNPV